MTVTFLHGSFGAGSDWDEVVTKLGRTALTPDLPAHGARFAESATSFEAVVDELSAQIAPGSDLVGYSLGGRLAIAVALRVRPRSLVLESAQPGLDEAARVERLARDTQGAQLLAESPAAFLDAFWHADLFASFRAHPDFQSVRAARIEQALRDPRALAATYLALSPGNQPELGRALGDAGIPTLFIAGALDQKYVAIGRRLATLAPNVSVDVVAGAGHNVHLERPLEFARALESFWSQLP